MNKKILMICSPGFKMKTGYYYRAIRDKVVLEDLGNTVEFFILSDLMLVVKCFFTLFKNPQSIDKYVCQNIGSVIPLFFASFLKPSILNKTILIYHGSLEDLIAFRFYKIKRFFYELIEARLVKSGSIFVCVSNAMKIGLENKYGQHTLKCHVLPNIPSPDFIENIIDAKNNKVSILRAELKLPQDKAIICYSGNAQTWQYVDFLFNMFAGMPDEFHLLILTIDFKRMNELKAKFNLSDDRITILTVDNFEVPRYLVAADYLYIVREQSEINEYSCPTKAVEYLYSGTKIICSENLGDISSFILENNLGIIVSKANIEDPMSLRNMLTNDFLDSNNASEKLKNEVDLSYLFGTNLQKDVYKLII